ARGGGVPIVPVQGGFRRKVNGSWRNAGSLMAKVNHLFARMPADEPDQSFQHYLDRTGESEEVKQQALGYVAGFHAANPALISVHSLIRDSRAEEAIEGDHQYRVPSGYQSIVQAMMDRIDPKNSAMVMNCVVKEISWRKNEVVVRALRAEYGAARAIVTLPLG